MRIQTIITGITLTLSLAAYSALAGNMAPPPGGPSAGSGMPTTKAIFQQLSSGTVSQQSTVFQGPSAGPGASGRSLKEIAAKLPVADNVNGAIAADVKAGKSFWGLRTDGTWGVKTGSVAAGGNVTGANGSLTVTIPDGLYSGGKTATAADTNLVTGNIKAGATIFGVSGRPYVVDTTEATAPAAAANISSGKKAFVNGALVTGTLYGGYTCTGTMNGTRWCDNGNGTVRDMTTGLIWLKDAGWGGSYPWWASSSATTTVFDRVSTLANGAVLTGTPATLTDGSAAGNWRMPTKAELVALTTGTEAVLSGTPRAFSAVQADVYWSGSSSGANGAWDVYMGTGYVEFDAKVNYLYVWPVRSGQ